MMLIICSTLPFHAVDFLIKHTNKNFVFKQLLELCQLICSAGISDVYKKIPQGKELQEWVKNNPEWIWYYLLDLKFYCCENLKLSKQTIIDINNIHNDLFCFADLKKSHKDIKPQKAIFRYKEGYQSQYQTNTLLPIHEAVKEYRKYIIKYKFPKDNK